MASIAVFGMATILLAGCHTQPKKQSNPVQASYGIQGDEEVEEDIPMPAPVDLTSNQKVSIKESALDAYRSAVDKNKEAAAVHFEWNNTRDVLKMAENLIKKGEYAESIKHSEMAFYFAERGLDQAKASKTVTQNYLRR